MAEIQKTSLSINNNKCIQEHFYGATAIYHAYTFREDFPERQYTEEECNIELERVKNMELKIARTYFDLCAFENGEWNWENADMQALYKWLGKMQEFGVDVALNAAWWVTGHIMGNEESPLYDKNPKKAAENYGKWVSEVVHQIIELRGFTNVKYLVILTEPNTGCWDLSCNREDLPGYKAYELCTRAVDRQLRADGRRKLVKLVGPNTGVPDFGNPTMLEWASQNLDDCIDIYSAHTYVDYKDDPDLARETYDGYGSLAFNVPGYRAQQYVKLEPHTDYELSVYAKAAEGSDKTDWERGFLFGAFKATSLEGRLISAGFEGISYLTENSVATVPASEISDTWKKHKMQFNTGENDYAYIGIFHDVIPFDVTVFYDTASLHKVGDDTELLENGDFEDRESEAWLAFRGGLGYSDEKLPLYFCMQSIIARYLRRVPEGKEFWFDEYNARFYDPYTDPKQGIALAEMQAAFINMGVNSNMIWSLFDQQWPKCHWDGFDSFVDGDHRCGTMPVLKRSHTPYPAYYAFTLMSKYLGDHDSRVFEGATADKLCASCVQGRDGHYGIMVVNTGEEPNEVEISFEGVIGRNLYRHLYDSAAVKPDERAEILGIDKEFVNVEKAIKDVLPANSIAIYTTRMD